MKRTIEFGRSVIVLLCALFLFSCQEEDNPVNTPYVPQQLPDSPTNDVVDEQIQGLALFIGSENSGNFSALKRRLTNTSASLGDNQLMHVVIAANQVANINEEQAEQLRAVIGRGGSIVVTSPNANTVKKLAELLGKTVDIPLIPSTAQPLALMAVKRGKTYFSLKLNNSVQAGMLGATDYIYGKKMDALTAWLSKPAEPFAFRADSGNKTEGELEGNIEEALQDLVPPQEIVIDAGLHLAVKTGDKSAWGTYHNIQQTYRIWKAHSFDTNEDFYCIKEEITAYNNDLCCRPEDEDEWNEASKDWKAWRDAMDKAGRNPSWELWARIYGPYMHSIKITNSLKNDAGNPVRVLAYDPENSSTGGVTTTESFSYSLGGNVGANASGPMGGVNVGLTWGTSVAKFSADLAATATTTIDGSVAWTYIGARPGSHWGLFKNSHDTARSILRNTCTLHHAWVWSVPSFGKGVVHLVGDYEAADEWLTYYTTEYETHEVYIPATNPQTWTYDITTPPQYKQQWTMFITPVNTAVEEYLVSHLGEQYYWPSGTFFTEKETHTDADTDDEISTYVKASKELFDKNLDIMKQAAEAGGLSGGYTISWKNVNSGKDEPDFTYEVKAE